MFPILFLKELAWQPGIALHLLGGQEARLETRGPAAVREARVVGDEKMPADKAIGLDRPCLLPRYGGAFPSHTIPDRFSNG